MKTIALITFCLLLSFFVINRGLAGAADSEKIPAADAWKMIKAGALVVDVRTPDEFASGHLDGALNIPYDQVAARLNEFGPDKNRKIVLYCRSGHRSGIAEETLKQHGFAQSFNAGGYEDLLPKPQS